MRNSITASVKQICNGESDHLFIKARHGGLGGEGGVREREVSLEELMGAVLSVACSYVPGWSGNPPGDVMRLEEREDNAVRVHRMGEDEDEIRSDEEGGQLMRSEEEEEEEKEEKGEKVPWKSLEGDDVMSRLFDWDFDQLLRQVSLS